MVDVHEPRGWEHVDVGACGKDGLLKVWLVQICILLNHQNGKDTHVRKIRLYAPRDTEQQLPGAGEGIDLHIEPSQGVNDRTDTSSRDALEFRSRAFTRGLDVR